MAGLVGQLMASMADMNEELDLALDSLCSDSAPCFLHFACCGYERHVCRGEAVALDVEGLKRLAFRRQH